MNEAAQNFEGVGQNAVGAPKNLDLLKVIAKSKTYYPKW